MRLTTVAWLVTLGWFCAADASAQEESPQYRRRIADAVSEFNAGHWIEANTHFRAAHNESPNARTARGIGMTAFELGDHVEAVRYLETALRSMTKPLTSEQRVEVNELLARARGLIGRFRIHVEPASATIAIRGSSSQPEADGSYLLARGRQQIVVSTPERSVVREIEVTGGEDNVLVEVVVPAAAPVTAVTGAPLGELPDTSDDAGSPAGSAASSDEAPNPNRSRRILWGLSAGLWVAAGATAAWFYRAQRAWDTCLTLREHGYEDHCPDSGEFATPKGDYRKERNLAAGFAVAGGTLALTATALALIKARDPNDRPVWLWTVAGVLAGGAATAVGGLLGAGTAEDICLGRGDDHPSCSYDSDRTAALVATIGLGAGSVASAVAALVIKNPRQDDSALTCVPSLGGLSCGARF